VKEEDTVTVGHVVASIIDKSSDSSGGEHQDSSLAAGGQSDTNTSQNATAITDDVAPVVEKARVPSISFPRRRTPQGDVISLLPAGQAAEYANPAFASSFASSPTTTKSTTKSTTTTATQAAPIRSAPEPPRLFLKVPPRTGPAVRRPSALRKELSDREIEAIMLGGLND
jgi:pyruvate/2-oxoglutarate dehydrogenase complex dihydrolipoamide acyltransferase (E2) component